MMAPCGNSTKASRFGVAPAALCAHAVAAGCIASRSGSAMAAPTPFNTRRRETCFFVRYIVPLPLDRAEARCYGPVPQTELKLGAAVGRQLSACRDRRPRATNRRRRHAPHPEL